MVAGGRARGDVSKELSGLLSVVGGRFGLVVARVSLSAPVWDATPEQISVGARVVRVAWFRARDAHMIRLLGGRFWHGGLLVIPRPPDGAGVGGRGRRRRRVAGHRGGGGGFIVRPVISLVVFSDSSGECGWVLEHLRAVVPRVASCPLGGSGW
jgi:hypothetical protein